MKTHEQICSDTMQYLVAMMIAVADIGMFASGEITQKQLQERIQEYVSITKDAASESINLILNEMGMDVGE